MDLPIKRRSSFSHFSPRKRSRARDPTNSLFNRLSSYIFQGIFDFLSTRDLILSLSRVDKIFNKFVHFSLFLRSNLSFNLNKVSECLYKRQIRESTFLRYMSSRNLKKIELTLTKYYKCEGKNRGLRNILSSLKKINTLRSVESFKLNIRNFDTFEIKDLLGNFQDLRCLKFSSNLHFPKMIQFIMEKVLMVGENPCKIYLKYSSFDEVNTFRKLMSILKTPTLTHFSLKFTNSFLNPIILKNLELPPNLIFLHLPAEFTLTHDSSKSLCRYLISNKTLQSLSINSTISKSLQYLVTFLTSTQTLHSFKLLTSKSNRNPEDELSSVDCIELFKAVSKSNLVQFETCTFFTFNAFLHLDMPKEDLLKGKFEAYLKAFFRMLESNQKLKKIDLTIEQEPYYITTRFCKILVDCVKRGMVEYLFGYNIYGLLNGTVKVIEVKRNHSFMNKGLKKFKMISYMFRMVLPYVRDLEWVVESKVFCIRVGVKRFLERIKKGKESYIRKTESELVNLILILLAEGVKGCKVYFGDDRELLCYRNFYKVFNVLDSNSRVSLFYGKK